MIRTHEEHLAHYGILRKSGRYPWGSGSTQSQRNRSFLDITGEQRKQGMTDAQIAKSHGISVVELRAAKSIAVSRERQARELQAFRYREKGWGYSEIGRRMNLNESSVRSLIARHEKDKSNALHSTANMLKKQVDEKGMIDVSVGSEKMIGVTRSRFDTAIAVLKEQGYQQHVIYQPQVTGKGKYTPTKVLAKPGITQKHAETHREDIRLIQEYSNDHGRTFNHVQPPISINSRRIKVNYGPDGGREADGMIYVRPGVKDLQIGNNRYGQVRILVDGTHYLKGMAAYKDDLPAGTDIVFNTKAHNTGRKKDAMKPIDSKDPNNPFGSIIRQVHDPTTGKVISAMNMVGSPTKEGSGEEGAWDKWSRDLSSQMLSKQSPKLAQQQLNVTYERRVRELAEINSLTNPRVRKELLNKFADSTDSAASHLQAAALPRTANRVLLPVTSMKRNEIHAPGFNDGERVVLIRHPHGGKFEIPELTVNNRNREALRIIGRNAKDAVGIHHSVAERLSGADFDGDTVLVIPNNKRSVEHTPALEGLKGFDPQVYKIAKGSPVRTVTPQMKGYQMGNVSNLITDMTLRGANTEELSRAIRHSMVVIDSEKHQLDWKRSEQDHGILALKAEYQGGKQRGASTLISRAGAQTHIPQRNPRSMAKGGPVDPVTGKKVYEPTGKTRKVYKWDTDPVTGKRIKVESGKLELVTEKHRRLSVTDDAFDLSSGTPMEAIYAEHSNRLKAMANDARKQALPLKGTPKSETASKVYHNEVKTLNEKLNRAERNAPYERHAQRIANTQVSQIRQANPGMEQDDVKKVKQQQLNEARIRTGAKKYKIDITQQEWDAIQAGAISNHKLERILYHSDMDTVKRLALPKHTPKLTSAKMLRAQGMLDNGFTQQEVADALGIGLTTLKVALNE